MILGTSAASLLGSILTGERVIRAGEGTIRVDQDFKCHLFLSLILEYKNIIKRDPNPMAFIQEIIHLK